jgi:hypothetical protein
VGEKVAIFFGPGDSRISLGLAGVETSIDGLESGVAWDIAVSAVVASAFGTGEAVSAGGEGVSAQMALTGTSVGVAGTGLAVGVGEGSSG